MRVTVSSEPTAADFFTIFNCLDAESTPEIGPCALSQVALLLHGDDSTVVGGLWGHIAYRWLTVDLFFVPPEMRQRGVGSDLLDKAEALAGERGCRGIQLMTYAFQAPRFYEQRGFEIFSEQEEPTTGRMQLHFVKHLRPREPIAAAGRLGVRPQPRQHLALVE